MPVGTVAFVSCAKDDMETGSPERPATDNDALNIAMHRVEQASDETSFAYRTLVPAQAVAEGGSLFWFINAGSQRTSPAAMVMKRSIRPC